MALSADGKFQYPTGKKGALALKYNQAIVENAPPELLESFCSVGNPFSIDEISPGAQVLDIGCGAGFDMMQEAGFQDAEFLGETGFATSEYTGGALFRGYKGP